MDIRIGFGYDLHPLIIDRPLVLGGVTIPFEKGLSGHSDADALLHAITDALLGSLALGDIGTHFPDSDPEWKGADSGYLLSSVKEMVSKKGYVIQNVDATIIAEAPKLKPYIDNMRRAIASLLMVDMERVSVKATTNEGMDAVGRKDAIAVHAVVLIGKG